MKDSEGFDGLEEFDVLKQNIDEMDKRTSHIRKNRVMNELKQRKLIVILRGVTGSRLFRMIELLLSENITFFELAVDNGSKESIEKSIHNIEKVSAYYGNSAHIGAGTVLDAEQVKHIADIGGEYIISPNYNEKVIQETKRLGMISIPGALTPGEITEAYEMGADIVKVFPAGCLGAEYVNAVRAPLKHIPMAAVGGITPDRIPEFRKAGVDFFGVGSDLADTGIFRQYGEEEAYDMIRRRAGEYAAALKEEDELCVKEENR